MKQRMCEFSRFHANRLDVTWDKKGQVFVIQDHTHYLKKYDSYYAKQITKSTFLNLVTLKRNRITRLANILIFQILAKKWVWPFTSGVNLIIMINQNRYAIFLNNTF